MHLDSLIGEDTNKILRREKFLSLTYQKDLIKGILDQVKFANNPDVLPDSVLYLGIRRRYEQ